MEVLRGRKKIFFVSLFCLFALFFAGAEDALSLGCGAYGRCEWESAVLFFKKAQSLKMLSDEAFYMLIRSEVQLGDVQAAQDDCERFIDSFSSSAYFPYVLYQNGKLLHQQGRNERAVMYLWEFCRKNPGSFLYANALYFMAESFFDEYNFDSAKSLYTKVVCDFPSNANVPDAKYKIQLIENRAREEKLLYLLKVVGEESLSAREEYDRQITILKLRDEAENKRQGRGK